MLNETDQCVEDIGRPKESMESLERRHESERECLKSETKLKLKNAKKSEKAVVEAQMLQLEYDMRARHNEELEILEQQIGIIYNFNYHFISR